MVEIYRSSDYNYISKKLPNLKFANVTGGELTLRKDIRQIVKILIRKAKYVVISPNGYFIEKIVTVPEKFKERNFA